MINDAQWHYDYIRNDILHDITNIELETFVASDLRLFINRNVGDNILFVNSTCLISDINEVAKNIRPHIIFYTSDEGGITDVAALEQHTRLVIRQYNFNHIRYGSNSIQMPLGYVSSFLTGESSLRILPKKLIERSIDCSFIGEMKSDRQHMYNVLNSGFTNSKFVFVKNTWNVDSLQVSPRECFDIYSHSVFTACPRGWTNLDSFRLYEAIVCGSIPIQACKIEEFETTFNFGGDIPPIVYADTWEEVLMKCRDLLENQTELQTIQDNLLAWRYRLLSSISARIKESIYDIQNI